jgi:hypothetical protein
VEGLREVIPPLHELVTATEVDHLDSTMLASPVGRATTGPTPQAEELHEATDTATRRLRVSRCGWLGPSGHRW